MHTVAAFRTKLTLTQPALRTAAAELWQLPHLADRYPEYLRTMHGVIRASVPLMELAARRCADRNPGDAVTAPLRRYFERHIVEERDHDAWLLADLRALGADPDRPVKELPPASVARLVGPQYYWIEHGHPLALLGYIAVLESNAPAHHLADWIASAGDIPVAALRTVRKHAELDGGHTDAIYDLLDTLPLTEADVATLAISGLVTAEALMDVFACIVRAWRPAPRRRIRATSATGAAHEGDRHG
jgi:hypothetical protein